MNSLPDRIRQAASLINRASSILIGAGAGMGVDSGLPDFRGSTGFWNAYPVYKSLGLRFERLATPQLFRSNVAQAWGFCGHRLSLYRGTVPHSGFEILRSWCTGREHFIYTSNVDGHFQRAGFNDQKIVECHGSLNHFQCRCDCVDYIFPACGYSVEVDEETMLAKEPLPACDQCGGGVRPNVLMFQDWSWCPTRTSQQESRYHDWCRRMRGEEVVVIEIGCGTAIPTVREECHMQASSFDATHIRINPREASIADGLAIELPAREALARLDEYVTPRQTIS